MPPDERTYWTQQMDAAHAFMQRLLDYPVAECGEPLRCLRGAAGAAGVDVAFPDGRKLGQFTRSFLVRVSLVEPILRLAEALLRRGYVLWLEEAYRSPDRQAEGARSDYVFRHALQRARWEARGEPTPELVFRRLSVWSATTPKFANHTAGSAVDVYLLHRRARTGADLGAPYPEFSHRTPMDSPFISAEARRLRGMLRERFAEEGFLPYPYEFWHFSRGDADCELLAGSGRPARFGPVHWDGDDGPPVPVRDPLEPFITLQDVARRMGVAAARRAGDGRPDART